MNLDFIPYRLNADISDFKGNIQYISSDNGVDLYRAKEGFIKLLLGFPVTAANLYFFDGSLITVYIQLGEVAGSLYKVKGALEKAILEKGKALETDSGFLHYWQDKRQFLGLLMNDAKSHMLLYHSLSKFNIFKL